MGRFTASRLESGAGFTETEGGFHHSFLRVSVPRRHQESMRYILNGTFITYCWTNFIKTMASPGGGMLVNYKNRSTLLLRVDPGEQKIGDERVPCSVNL